MQKMKRNLFVVSILWLLIATTGWSQKLELAPTPLAGGFSAERLKVLDTRLNEWVEKGWMQGGTALIARNGKITVDQQKHNGTRAGKILYGPGKLKS